MHGACSTVFSFFRYLKSTISNIKLISQFRMSSDDVPQPLEVKAFIFWMEFLIEATKEHFSSSQFPVSYVIDSVKQICICNFVFDINCIIYGFAKFISIVSSCFIGLTIVRRGD